MQYRAHNFMGPTKYPLKCWQGIYTRYVHAHIHMCTQTHTHTCTNTCNWLAIKPVFAFVHGRPWSLFAVPDQGLFDLRDLQISACVRLVKNTQSSRKLIGKALLRYIFYYCVEALPTLGFIGLSAHANTKLFECTCMCVSLSHFQGSNTLIECMHGFKGSCWVQASE